uniref:RCC1 domain-containing protein n=1 Tax=Stigmatella hybrida TaxID=394097 RepID=UPI001CDABFA3|nr:hypothetical protein [Stigmatella hybrida]
MPGPIPGLSQVVSLAASSHVLALRRDGTVWAWGSNRRGELGRGMTSESGAPQPVPGLHGVTAIAAADGHSLALRRNGTLWGWGDNGDSTLGTGTGRRSLPGLAVGLGQVRELTSNMIHVLAVREDGTVWTWGNVNRLSPGQPYVAAAARIEGLSGVVSASAGPEHSLAVREDGTVWAWGDNFSGQLGNGTLVSNPSPMPVQGLTGIVAVAAGSTHSLALRADGTVWGWGSNWAGQSSGEPSEDNAMTPTQVQGLSGVVSIRTGMDLSVAVRGDGSVWYWGASEDSVEEPQLLQVPGLTDITTVAVNRFGIAAVRSDGTVWQWRVTDRQTGTPPQQVAGATDAVDTAYSFNTLQLLRSNGTVWNLGENFSGERGFPSEQLTPPGPSWVPGLTGVVSLSSGPFSQTVLALRGNGTVASWGSNAAGLLGSGVSPLHLEPARVLLPCRLKVSGAEHEAPGGLWHCASEH